MKKLKAANKIIRPTSQKELAKVLNEDVRLGKPAAKRSPHWASVRGHHLENNPACVACGRTERLQVHHIRPFHVFPELELDPANLMTLCEMFVNDGDDTNDNHHLHLGHGGDFRNTNEKVLDDVNDYRLQKAKLPPLINL
jgi:hypothetical protein